MIKEVIMYTVVCDNCGKDHNKNEEIAAWNDKNYAQECAMNSNWLKEEDKHYCTDCYSYGDNDELIIKTELAKSQQDRK